MRPFLPLALLVLLAAAPPAEARFGKRSRPPPAAKSDAPHAATAPDAEDKDEDKDEAETSADSCDDCGGGGSSSGWLFLLDLFTPRHVRSEVHVDVGDVGNAAPARGHVPLSLTLGVEGLSLPGARGSGAVGRLALEGERWGVSLRALGLQLPTDDGSYGTDRIGLLDAQLTYALIARERLRLRLELGMNSAQGADVSFISPAVGSSLELCLVGPLDVEARLQLVPFPDRVLDAQAGLALHLGAFGLHGGWRALLLDDAGLVDGVRHTDAFGGPYVGASVVF